VLPSFVFAANGTGLLQCSYGLHSRALDGGGERKRLIAACCFAMGEA
jgi:hypothetical protein